MVNVCSMYFISDDSVVIKADPHSKNATKVWDKMKVKRKHEKVHPMDPKTPISEDKIRFVCISDTHSTIETRPPGFIPNGDILLHAGDFTNVGKPKGVKTFNEYIGMDITFSIAFKPLLSYLAIFFNK